MLDMWIFHLILTKLCEQVFLLLMYKLWEAQKVKYIELGHTVSDGAEIWTQFDLIPGPMSFLLN